MGVVATSKTTKQTSKQNQQIIERMLKAKGMGRYSTPSYCRYWRLCFESTRDQIQLQAWESCWASKLQLFLLLGSTQLLLWWPKIWSLKKPQKSIPIYCSNLGFEQMGLLKSEIFENHVWFLFSSLKLCFWSFMMSINKITCFPCLFCIDANLIMKCIHLSYVIPSLFAQII